MHPQNDEPGSKGTIYAIDDEPMLLELTSAILEPLGYKLETFRDPEDALRAFGESQEHPALVITDYAMRSMNGLQLIAACRSIAPRQKCLLVSGTVDTGIYWKSSSRPDGFLAKPFQAKELIDTVTGMVAG